MFRSVDVGDVIVTFRHEWFGILKLYLKKFNGESFFKQENV
jgi:hypothetical protein